MWVLQVVRHVQWFLPNTVLHSQSSARCAQQAFSSPMEQHRADVSAALRAKTASKGKVHAIPALLGNKPRTILKILVQLACRALTEQMIDQHAHFANQANTKTQTSKTSVSPATQASSLIRMVSRFANYVQLVNTPTIRTWSHARLAILESTSHLQDRHFVFHVLRANSAAAAEKQSAQTVTQVNTPTRAPKRAAKAAALVKAHPRLGALAAKNVQ